MKMKVPLLRYFSVLAFLASISGAYAANIVVTSGANSGAGTLRAAITTLNGSAGPHLITFDAAVTVVTLTTDLPLITRQMTIDGGASKVIVQMSPQADGPYRPFNIGAGADGSTFKNLDVRGGGHEPFRVDNSPANLTFQNIVCSNTAGDFWNYGILAVGNASGYTVKNFIMRNIQNGFEALRITGTATNLMIDSLKVIRGPGTTGVGIRVIGAASNVTINNSYIDLDDQNTGDDGDYCVLFDGNVNGLNMDKDTLRGSDLYGIYVGGTLTNFYLTNSQIRQESASGVGMGIRVAGVVNGFTLNNVLVDMNVVPTNDDADYGIYFNTNVSNLNINGLTSRDAEIYHFFVGGTLTTASMINSTFTNFNGWGGSNEIIRFNSTVTGLTMTNVTVDCDVTGTTDDANNGIGFAGAVSNATLTNVSVNEADDNGLYTWVAVNNFVLNGGRFTKNYDGIEFYNCNYARTNVDINNVRIDNSERYGILYPACTGGVNDDVDFTGDTITRSGYDGLYIFNANVATDITISGCVIRENGRTNINGDGIQITAPDNVVITQNSISNNAGLGINLTGNGNCNLEGTLAPIINSVTPLGGGQYQVNYTIPAAAGAGTYKAEFFTNNPIAGVEGEFYVHTVSGLTTGTFNTTFTSNTGPAAFPKTASLTMTYTRTGAGCNGTSEFSNALGLNPQGPACVNNGILGWYRADRLTGYTDGQSMSELLDFSGNGNKFKQYVAAEQPKYFAGDASTNFNPSITYNGTSSNFEIASGLFPINTGGTFLSTQYHTNIAGDWARLYDQNTDDPSLIKQSGDGQIRFWDNGNLGQTFNTRLFANNVSNIRGFDYGTTSGTTNMYFDGISSANLGATPSPEAGIGYIGGLNNIQNWNGKIHEVIFYNRELTAAERQRINSYLSIRWGVSIDTTIMKVAGTGNDYQSADGTVIWTANNTYYHRITGIGRDDCDSLIQKQSRNVNTTHPGYVTMGLGTIAANNGANTNNFSADKSFLVWADDGKNGSTTTTITGDGVITLSGGACAQYSRMAKTFKVQETGTVGNVQMEFNMIGVKLGKTAADYYLAINNTNLFTGTITKLVPASSYSNVTGKLVFDNVDFTNGQFFTVIGKRVYGPANITSNLKLWLKAEDGIELPNGSQISLWADQGPAVNDASQATSANQPIYNTTEKLLNFNPTVSFNGATQRLITANSIFGTGSINYNTFGVVYNNAVSGGDYWLFDGATSCNNAAGFAHAGANWAHINYCNDLANGTVEAQTAYIELFTRKGTTPFTRNNIINGRTRITNNVGGLNKLNGAGCIGARNDGVELWGGMIGEIVAYETELSAADQQKVNSYLAVKWGITLDQTTPYNYTSSDGTVIWDATANATYKTRITGIGRDDCSDLYQRQSRNQDTTTAFVTLGLGTVAATNIANTGTFGADKNFLLWGDDNVAGTTTTTVTGDGTISLNPTACGVFRRLGKTFKTQETGSVGPVQVKVHLRGISLAKKASDLYLAIHSSATFSGVITKLVQASSLSNGVVTFDNVDFSGVQYFTVIGQKAQGPGNLTANLKLWVKADEGVVLNGSNITNWIDQGPAGNDASQATVASQPLFNSSSNLINFNPSVSFNGTSHQMKTATNIFGTGNLNYSVFGIVNAANSGAYRYWLSDGNAGCNSTVGFGHNALNMAHVNWCNDLNSGATSLNQTYLELFTRDASAPERNNILNGKNVGTSVVGGLSKVNGSGTIGNAPLTAEYWSGRIGEIIAFEGLLTAAEQQKVNSYLAIKWGLNLDQTSPYNYVSANGTVIWNATTYAAYNNRITGVGRDDCSDLLQKQSKNQDAGALVTISNGSSIAATNEDNTSSFGADNSWLLFGDNNRGITWTGSGVPINGGNVRLNRVWRVKETGTVGAVYLEVPDNTSAQTPKLPATTFSIYLLVANSSTNGKFSAMSGVTVQQMTFDATNKKWYTTYNFNDGDYFTFGSEKVCIAPVGISEGLTAWYSATDLATGAIAPNAANALSDLAFGVYPMNRNGAGTATVLAGSATSFNYNRSIGLSGNASFFRSGLASNDVLENNAGSMFAVGTANTNLFGLSSSSSNVTGINTGALFNGTSSTYGAGISGLPNVYTMVGSTTNVTGYTNGTAGIASGSITARASASYTLGLGQNGSNAAYNNGTIAEAFAFNRVLDPEERLILETYLAVKYGQTLSHNYFNADYDGSNAATTTIYDVSTYPNRVFGVGTDTTGCFYQKQSTSALSGSMLKMSINTSFAAENSGNTAVFSQDRAYVMAGDNNGDIASWLAGGGSNPNTPSIYSTTCELPKRIGRQWKVTGTYTTPTILFAIPDASSSETTKLPTVPAGYSVWMVLNDDPDFGVNALQQEIAMTLNPLTSNWEGQYLVPAGKTRYVTFVLKNNAIATGAQGPVVTIAVAENSCTPDDGKILSGASTTLTPTAGASYLWSNASTNPSITVAPIINTTYTVTVTASNGCTGTASTTLTIVTAPTATITETDNSCLANDNKVISGDPATLTAAGGTTYSWENLSTSAVRIVTPASNTTYTVTVSDNNGCTASANITITIVTPPAVSLTGASSICVGDVTGVSPTSGGTWASSDAGIATVTNAGVVTGISAGSVVFTFTSSSTGCVSSATSPVTVNALPVATITGSNNICIGSTTNLSPATGGFWTSSDPAIATVTNSGVVTGVSAGTATFTFTNTTTGCVSAPTSAVTVNTLPVVSITGASTICAGGTTTLSPTTGGIWVSSNPSVATVTNGGLVTAQSAGTVTFTFTKNTAPNCSATTAVVTVNALPLVSVTGPTTICAGTTTTLTPSSGGTWASSNPAVATVTNAGVVTGVSGGTVTFTFTDVVTGCTSLPTPQVTVDLLPVVAVTGNTNICTGGTTALSPVSGGTWVSSNPAVATVTNAGVVTGVSAGTVTFTFTSSATGCTSLPTSTVTITALPVVSITGASTICVGTTTSLSPNSGGTWVSSDPAVATVTNAGVVTGVSGGTATFTFTSSTSPNCSMTTGAVTIVALPMASVTGVSTICAGATTTLSPTSGGSWVSSNPSVATVTNAGVVTGVSAGTATFTFTSSATGCTSLPTGAVTVNALPVVAVTGSSSICAGLTTTLSPTSGGTWASSDPTVATVTNSGVVTGVTPGTVTFTFTNSITGCISQPTAAVTVNPIPVVTLTGLSNICVGAMSGVAPTSGGTWASSNAGVASITNAGVITGVSAGTATFTYTDNTTGCVSAPTSVVTVNPTPIVVITGASSICIGGTTTLSPASGGAWTSSNPAIATVSNSGVVTGVSAGSVTFTFTNGTTGCTSGPTAAVTVNAPPVVSVTGSSSLCIGNTTTLSPTSGGTWASSDPTVATVTNAGVVTAVGPGTATFIFTSGTTGCASAPTGVITVNAPPVVSITGPNSICVGATTGLSPSSGGTWVSSNPSVATVTNAGVVTGISAGTATFTFTNSTTGCVSAPTAILTVNAIPTVSITGATSLCIGGTSTLSPGSGGTWVSTNPGVATVTNAGIITAISAGTATFIYTNSATGCVSAPSSVLTVEPTPIVSIIGATDLCIGGMTGLSPSSGGTWVSSNPAVATVTNAGVVTAVAPGTATFTFTNTTTGCVSAPTSAVTVYGTPVVGISGPSIICAGGTTSLTPSSGGTWVSSNPAIATVTNSGVVTGVSAGSVTFTFTNSSTGCVSPPTAAITVNALPIVSITGGSNICVGATTTLSPTSGGVWSSSNPAVASVTNSGIVTGLSAGTATFTFTNSITGCVSAATLPVTVNPIPSVSVSGPSSICAGATTTLSPVSGGSWVSSNPAVATVTNAGVVTAVAAGTATFTFTNTTTGCVSAPTSAITVNALPIASVTGGSSICVGGTTTLLPNSGGTWSSSNPAVATVTNAGVVTGVSAGTVTFTFTSSSTGCSSLPSGSVTVSALPVASITGVSSICVGSTTTLSPTSGGVWSSSNPAVATVTNAGVVTGISAGTATFIFTNALSGCASAPTGVITVNAAPTVNITGANNICIGSTTTLSPTSGGTWASSNPSVASVTNGGVVTGLSAGTVTFTFTNSTTGCVSAPTQAITVNGLPAVSVTGSSSICIGSTTTLTPASGGTWTSSNPAVATVTNAGVVTGVGAGTVTFTFTSSSTGCVSAPTTAVTVAACNSLAAVKVFLGGPYDAGVDLMKDNLRAANLIPNGQPYGGTQYSDFNYTGTETIGAGVLNISGNNAIVDWVLLELRSPADPAVVLARKAALVQRDGDVVEASDGTSAVVFTGATAGNYYVAVKHRNHLGVMTATAIALSGSSAVSVNFTSAATANYQLSGASGTIHAQRTLPNGKRALWEGNMSNSSGTGNLLQFQGANSDSDEAYYRVLLDPGNVTVIPNYVVNAYDRADANLDGMVIYQGSDSDSDIPFFNVLSFPDNTLFLPNFLIYQQIP